MFKYEFLIVVIFLIGLLSGGLIGAYFSWIKAISKRDLALAISNQQKELLETKEKELSELMRTYVSIEKEKSSLQSERDYLQLQKQKLEQSSKEISETLEMRFASLANKILDEKSKKFDETSKQELNHLMNPLKEKIKEFQEHINKKHESNLQEQASLKKEIQFIAERGKEMSVSADSLSRALRGDSKVQGKWGEMILERVLENSGLRNGCEFSTQSSYQSEEGNIQRPDVTLYLSNNRQLFIDSKVSLTHYDKYIRAEDEFDKKCALEELEKAFCYRIKELGDKKYQQLKDGTSVDFVIMFAPIESVLSLVAQNYEASKNKTLFEYAWEKGVVIASPLTLMPILKTINLCWTASHQNKNALAIAQEASTLHEKFVRFIEKFEEIDKAISKAQKAFDDTKSTLVSGKLSLAKGFDKLKKHLKKDSKPLPAEYESDDHEFFEEGALEEDATSIDELFIANCHDTNN